MFEILLSVISGARELASLLDDNDAILLFADIGDHLGEAAKRALEDSFLSTDKNREIESAITNLRAAYEFYCGALRKSHFLGIFPRHKLLAPNYWKACEVTSIIAVCYELLGETALAGEYLDRAKRHITYFQISKDTYIERRSFISVAMASDSQFSNHLEDMIETRDADEREQLSGIDKGFNRFYAGMLKKLEKGKAI